VARCAGITVGVGVSPVILHGPGLAAVRPPNGIKQRPCTWTLGARVQANTVDAVERLARLKGCKPGDILRTALAEFLQKYALTEPVSHLTDQTPSQTITQPRTAKPYTGSGGSDQLNINAARTRQNARKANGQQGERLIDKSVVR